MQPEIGRGRQGPVGFWFLNDRLAPAVIERQLDEFHRQGFSGVVLHPRDGLETPYLSETWFRGLKHILHACKARGLQAWFYDENPFPSGAAGGRVLNQYPHLVAQSLGFHQTRTEVREGTIYLALPGTGRLLRVYAARLDAAGRAAGPFEDVTAFTGLVSDQWYVQGKRVMGYGPSWVDSTNIPHWRAWACHECWTLDWPVNTEGSYLVLTVRIETGTDSHHGHYVDLLNPETTQRFIELTHQRTLDRLGEETFRQFAAVFTDEPHITGPYPWTQRLPEEYQKAYQRDLLPDLPHLALDLGPEGHLVRYQYRRLLSRLYDESYFEPIARWCREHQVPFSGHVSPEEDPLLMALGNPGLPRLISRMDWPGYDLVLSPFGPAEPAKLIGPKLVASLGHQQAKSHLVAEVLGCCGQGLTLAEMRNMLHWVAVCGFDTFVLHGQFYSLDGHRKREAPPSIFVQAPYWRLFERLSDYLDLLSRWLTRGKPHRPIAVLLPLATFEAWVPVRQEEPVALAQNISELIGRMMAAGLDFDLVTDDDFGGATLAAREGSAEFTVGAASYKTLVVPAVGLLAPPAREMLQKFLAAEVRVESLTPTVQALGRDDSVSLASCFHARVERLVDKLVRKYRSWITFPASQKLYVQSRIIDGRMERMIWNPTDEAIKVTLSHPSTSRIIEPWQAEIFNEHEGPAECPGFAAAPGCQWAADWSLVPQVPNVLVLSRWQLQTANGNVHGVCLPTRSGVLPWGLDHQTVTLACELVAEDALPDTELWFDRSTFGGPFEIRVNGRAAGPAEDVHEYDLHERRVRVGDLLTPGRNRIEVHVGPVRPDEPAMLDPLRLVGRFKVLRTDNQTPGHDTPDVRPEWCKALCPDDPALSRIAAGEPVLTLTAPEDWTALGFPHYSGTMSYTGTLQVTDPAPRLFLAAPPGQRDAFDVRINGTWVGACAWSPWRLEITEHLHPGPNTVEIRVSNTAINRIEGKPQPSGLSGLPALFISARMNEMKGGQARDRRTSRRSCGANASHGS